MPVANEQKTYIYKLCGFNAEAKESAVLSITEGRTDSTSELSFEEANALIRNLGGTPLIYDNWAAFDSKKTSHMQILACCHELQWVKPDIKRGRIVDLHRLSEWLKSKSPVKKKLSQMEPKEISKVISALERMIGKKYSKR